MLNYACQIFLALLALQNVQGKNIIHRDLKPANIFLDARGNIIKIGDFGLARTTNAISDAESQKTWCGTPAYMAPEIFTKKYTCQVDMYSAGVILYELCTLEAPSLREKVVTDAKF